MIELRICGLDESQDHCRNWPADHVLSLLDPGVNRNYGPHHRVLNFDDIAYASTRKVSPTKEHIEQILEWAKDYKPGDKVLIHCHAGISRSTAVAMIVLCSMGLSPKDAADKVSHVRSQADPNPWIIDIGDYLLGLNDELVKEANRIRTNRVWVFKDLISVDDWPEDTLILPPGFNRE